MATIKDIAKKLKIATSTVSKGLNGATDISEDLRQQILDTAIEMGYQPKHAKKTENRKLCLMVENMGYKNPEDFGYEIVLGFQQIAAKEKWNVEIVEVTHELEKEERYDTYLLKNGYSGAFLLGFALDDMWMSQLEETTMPTVLFDNYVAYNLNVCGVGTDSAEGIGLAVDHLYSLGHRQIAFLNGSHGSSVTEERAAAFQAAMAEHELEVREELTGNGYFIPETAIEYVPGFIENGATAIICGNDLIAKGVYRECERAGLSIPKDMSVIGYDDILMSEKMKPKLTTIRQERNMLGRQAYMNLYSLIHRIPVARTVLRPRLIVRGSTGPCK